MLKECEIHAEFTQGKREKRKREEKKREKRKREEKKRTLIIF